MTAKEKVQLRSLSQHCLALLGWFASGSLKRADEGVNVPLKISLLRLKNKNKFSFFTRNFKVTYLFFTI